MQVLHALDACDEVTVAVQQHEWQRMENAPRDGTAVLLFHPDWETLRVGIYSDIVYSWQEPTGDLLPEPVLWRALPHGPSHFQRGPQSAQDC